MKPPKSRKAELGPNASGGEKSHAETAESAEFKMTELGSIPVDWEVKRLGEVAMVARGGSPRPIEAFLTSHDDGLNWVKIGDVGVGAKYIERTAEKILPVGLSSTRMVYPGDFLLSNSMSFGRPYIMKIAGCIHDGWLVIQDYKTTFDTEYLYYVLGSETVVNQYRVLAAGSSVLNLNKDVVARVTVVVPPLAEQRRIAGALSDVDELISALGKLIEKKRNIKTGAMQQLLTGKTRLPGFSAAHAEFKQTELGSIPVDWEVKRLGEVCEIVMGQSPASDYYNTTGIGYPLIQGNADICNRRSIIRIYTSLSLKICNEGDIIMSVRAPVGAVGRASYKSCLGRGVCALKTASDYLYHYLIFVEKRWGEFSKGSTFDSINSDELFNYELPVPPTLAEQKAIAAVLSDIDAEIAALEADRAKYESIKQGMMQELLTGKTRIGGFAAHGEAQGSAAGIGGNP